MPEKTKARKRSTKKVTKKTTIKRTEKVSKKAATKVPAKKAVAKTPAKKSPAVKKRVRPTAPAEREVGSATLLTQAERHQMISLAAYYRALARGEQLGGPEADWLAAESQIDVELAKAGIALRA
mgnify:CR=1 FL=1